MTWLKIPAVTLVGASKVVAVPDVDTSLIAPGDALVVEGVSELLEIEAVFAHQITLVKPWTGESIELAACVVPTAADFRKAAEILRKHSQVTTGNLQSLEDYWTKLGTVTFTGRDGTVHQARTLKQVDVDVKEIEDRLGDAAELGAQLVEDYDEQLGEAYQRVLAAQQSAQQAAVAASENAQTASEKAQQTEQNRQQTALDVQATAQDRKQTALDVLATASDRQQTASAAQATAQDRERTALDVLATAKDREVTEQKATATAADALATAADRLATGQDKSAAQSSAESAIEKAQQATLSANATAADKLATGQHLTGAQTAAEQARSHEAGALEHKQAALSQAQSSQSWAEEARRAANETFISGGTFTPDVGAEYPDYLSAERDTSWLVQFDEAQASFTYGSGPLAGKTVWNGDQIFIDMPAGRLTLIPNPTAAGVLSVNGVFGTSITLTATHIPYGDGSVSAALDNILVTLNGNTQSISSLTSSVLNHLSRISSIENTLPQKLDADATAVNAQKLGNKLPSYFATAESVTNLAETVSGKLDANETAKNADRLGNNLPSFFAQASSLKAVVDELAENGMAFVYNTETRKLMQQTINHPDGNEVINFTYVDGKLTKSVSVYRNITKTTTYTYTNGKLTGVGTI